MTENTARWLILGVLASLGLIFIGVGGVFLYKQYLFMSGAQKVEAVVIHLDINNSGDNPTYRPTVRYVDNAGDTREAASQLFSNFYDYEIGETIEVFHNHDRDDHIRIDGWFSIWGFGSIFFGVGLLSLMVGGIVFVVMTIAMKRRNQYDGETVL
ncbi:DUF3592 domain-containing protein [Pseudaestuariivita rosea]|uniref:DUF3592 domain-containing protein n=1 Tax=Pseudaestuariivita rosea TaxID=2763263 RepID=UPI001ABB6C3D|nr:DUF3592 domain-containing protein [Pseudaestuariivita rosea]